MNLLLQNIVSFAPVDPNTATEGSIGGLLLYIALALGVSFLCSIWEAVILSTSVSHIEVLVQEGRRAGRIMEKLRENVDQPIAAILTLNTIAHTVGAAGAGAQATAVFGNEFFGLISAILTLLILIFSEIIPKTLGAVYWRQLMPFTAYTVRGLVLSIYPAVWAFNWLTRLLTPKEERPTITREELEALAHKGALEGNLEEEENRILSNLFSLSDVPISNIMTPRTVVLALQEDMTIGDVIARHRILPYSRIPVYSQTADDTKAYVLRHEVLSNAAADRMELTLKEIARPLHAVPETNTVAQVLEEFITRKDHMFLVFDEFGGMSGIITLEDALESLLGVEITDESDLVEDLREMARQRYERQTALLRQLGGLEEQGEVTSPPSEGAENPPEDTD